MLNPARGNWIGHRLLAVAVVCGLALCASPEGALAAAKWLGPTDLSAPLRDANNVEVAMDDAGNLVAVWERSGTPSHPIQASVREAGGSYSAPIDLVPTGTAPQVAMTPSGTAIVVFMHFDPAAEKNLVQARIRPPGGSFAPTVDVAALEPGFSVNPRVAVNSAGDAAVVWLDQQSGKRVAQVSTRPAGGGFSEPFDLSEATHNASEPDLAIDPSGKALVVWGGFSEENPNVILFSSGKGGTFTTPDPISIADIAAQPQIALNSAGDPTVSWVGIEVIEPEGEEEPPEFEPQVIEASSRTGEGEFSAPIELSDSDKDAFEPQLAVSPAGEATVVWVQDNEIDLILQASIRPPGGPFSPPDDLSEDGEDALNPDLIVNSAGGSTVAWQGGGPAVIHASVRPAGGGSFGAPEEVSVPGQQALFPQVAMDQAGDAVVVWRRFNGADDIAQAAGYDANVPEIRSLSIPAQGTVGIPVGFAFDPFDVWPLASTVFDFGDGSALAGTSVSHAYSAPGSYPVIVTATDQAGNATSQSATIAISPSYDFRIGKHKRNKKRGTVQLTVVLPGPGNVVARGKGVKRQRKRAPGAGSVKVTIAAKGKALRRLNQKGKARVRVTISFAPDGGDHSERQRVLVVLIKKQ